MHSKDRVLNVLNLKKPDRIPTFEWFIDKNVGRTLIGSEDPIEIVKQLGLDGINVRADYTHTIVTEGTFKDEWGIVKKETEDCLPAVMGSPIEDITQHATYQFPELSAPHRFDSLRRAFNILGENRAVILNLRDGFSDMRDLLGYQNALIEMVANESAFMELIDRVVDYNLSLARRAVEAFDVKIVATTDDIATNSGTLMSPTTYHKVLGPAFRKVIRGYRDLGLKVIKHCDGDCSAVIDFWIEAGISCLDPIDPGAGFKMADFRKRYGDRICLKGNIDCTGVLEKGTPEEVKTEVKQCLIDGGPHFIISSSNTIHRGVQPENYAAMLEAVKEFG